MNDPDDARQLVHDVKRGMERVAHEKDEHKARLPHDSGKSPAQKEYGNRWSWVYGVVKGIGLMEKGRESEYDFESAEVVEHGITDEYWQEHYDQYGYGPHGDGLKLGKRLAFYSGDEFDFVEPEDSTDFTFVDPNEESQFTFTE